MCLRGRWLHPSSGVEVDELNPFGQPYCLAKDRFREEHVIQPWTMGSHVFQWSGQLLESSEKGFLVLHEMDHDSYFLPLDSNGCGWNARDGHFLGVRMESTQRKSGLREWWGTGTNPDCSACSLTSPGFVLRERKHLIIDKANPSNQSILTGNPFFIWEVWFIHKSYIHLKFT